METGFLHTGTSRPNVRKELKDEKKLKKQQIKPSAKVFLAELDKEILASRKKKTEQEIRELIKDGMFELSELTDVRVEKRLISLKVKIETIMRAK